MPRCFTYGYWSFQGSGIVEREGHKSARESCPPRGEGTHSVTCSYSWPVPSVKGKGANWGEWARKRGSPLSVHFSHLFVLRAVVLFFEFASFPSIWTPGAGEVIHHRHTIEICHVFSNIKKRKSWFARVACIVMFQETNLILPVVIRCIWGSRFSAFQICCSSFNRLEVLGSGLESSMG